MKDKKIDIKNEIENGKRKAKQTASDFEKFAFKGNIVDLAVGVIIGTAFTKIVNSLVNDIIMPSISIITGKIDFSNLFFALDGKQYATLEQAKTAGASVISYGSFFTAVVDFILVALTIFILLRATVYKWNNKKKDKSVTPPTTKQCQYCLSDIPIKATKCAHCTSNLENNTEV